MTSYDSLKYAARLAAESVYKAATRNKEAEEVVVKMTMSGSGLTDKYGNAVSGNPEMGTFTVTNLDEVRKYRNADSYAYETSVEMAYMAWIRRMQHAHLLK